MLITPPIASVPKPTGTTPLYTSMRSAKFTGMLFSPNEEPTPSCGTPSMNTFTCLPLKPSSIRFMSEPTPPLSRSFSPGALARASPSVFVVLSMSRVSTATALYAEFFTRLTPLDTTVTSARWIVSRCAQTGIAEANSVASSVVFNLFTLNMMSIMLSLELRCKGRHTAENPQSPKVGILTVARKAANRDAKGRQLHAKKPSFAM